MELSQKSPLLLVIADDLTGANDTGVQFAKKGIKTVVTVGWELDSLPFDYDVVVVNTESRHVSPETAANRVKRVASLGIHAGAKYFFKKTDSTLRGNIGAELKALLAATGTRVVPFIPAFPELGRITRDGIHLVNGIPISETEFASDPLSPVRQSSVANVLRGNAELQVTSRRVGEASNLSEGCNVFDCESRRDLRTIADFLAAKRSFRVFAGSAAFAEELPKVLSLRTGHLPPIAPHGPILMINGSLNPKALEQISRTPPSFQKIQLSPEVLLGHSAAEAFGRNAQFPAAQNVLLFSACSRDDYDFFQSAAVAYGLDPLALPALVANSTGAIVKQILARNPFGTIVVFGGDTLMGISRACGWEAFEPRTEVEAGITVARPVGHDITVISKAGGFSDSDVVNRIVAWIG